MTAIIGWLVTRTGIGSLAASIAAYAVIALIAGGSLWGYGAYKHHQGYSAGVTLERAAWEAVQRKALAAAAAQKAADQARIDQIEAEYLLLQQQLDAARAEAFLEEAIRKEAQADKPALPKGIAHALNGVR